MEKTERICPIGVFHRFVKPTEEWLGMIRKTREMERLIAMRYPTEEDQIHTACRRIASDLPQVLELLESAADTPSFCESVLAMSRPEDEADRWRVVRELVRLIETMLAGKGPPECPDDLLDLWNMANRLEPGIEDYLPAHFRTVHDPVPFTRSRAPESERPPSPLRKSAPFQEVPILTRQLLEWLQTPGLSPELKAFTAHHLLAEIHPFPEGNGHTARLLCLVHLSSVYGPLTLTAFLREMIRYRPFLFESIQEDMERDTDMGIACCDLSLLLICGQKRLLGELPESGQ